MSVDTADDVYLRHRDALFGLAYRMLGSVSDAEDVVAETYLRWRRADRDDVDNARSYLFSIASRLSLDLLKSAQRSRVDYFGCWLPEPLVTSYDDPSDHAVQRDTISLAFLYLLEQLSPQERAVYVLRAAFDFPHGEIAQLLEMSQAQVRQLHHRAQQRLGAHAEPRFAPDPQRVRELVSSFLAAASSGEIEPLARLLADDIVLIGDGGGKAAAVRAPMPGRLRVARFLRTLTRKTTPDMTIEVVRANGAPALLVRAPGEVIGVYALDVDVERGVVAAIHAVRNPDKLTRLAGSL